MTSERYAATWFAGALGSRRLVRGARHDVERVHGAVEKWRDRAIDQAVTLEPRAAAERLGHDGHAVVTAGAASFVTGVRGAVIEDLEGHRLVYAAVAPLFQGAVHALNIVARAPDELTQGNNGKSA